MNDSDDASLPPPLAAALAEFKTWTDGQTRAEQTRSTPRTTLYHYTNQTALHGIIERQKLWCFLHSQQSDLTEVQFSIDIAKLVIDQEAGHRSPAPRSLLLGLNDQLRNYRLDETFDFYFFSLSDHRDDPQQWEKYGCKGAGFSIGFAPSLFQPDRLQLLPQANENVFVGKVIYGRGATGRRHGNGVRKLAAIVERVCLANSNMVGGKTLQAWFESMNMAFIANMLIWNCLIAKDKCYRNERETRYILMGMCEEFDEFRKDHGGRKYVETPLPLRVPGNLTEIIVGPLAHQHAEDEVRAFLRNHGYTDSIPVTRSKIVSR